LADRYFGAANQEAIVGSVSLRDMMSSLLSVVSQSGTTLTPHLTPICRLPGAVLDTVVRAT